MWTGTTALFREEILASSHHWHCDRARIRKRAPSQLTRRGKLRVPPWMLQPYSDKMAFHALKPGLGSCHGGITGCPPSVKVYTHSAYRSTPRFLGDQHQTRAREPVRRDEGGGSQKIRGERRAVIVVDSGNVTHGRPFWAMLGPELVHHQYLGLVCGNPAVTPAHPLPTPPVQPLIAGSSQCREEPFT